MYTKISCNNKEIEIPTGIFLNNQFVSSKSGKMFDSLDPSNGNLICKVYEGNKDDVELAVQYAENGYKEWSKFSCVQRSDFLYKIYQKIIDNQDNLAFIEALDQGKPYTIAKKYDVAATAFTFKYYAGWADKFYAKQIPGQNNEISFTKNEPYGVTAGIIPWNYPLMFIGWKAAPALAAGNVIIIKPSEKTPLSALYFAHLIKDILPPGVIQIINGYGPTAGEALAMHPKIKKIAFTGSTPVGRRILHCSSVSNLKKVSLELGGKSPNIICDDADLKMAVQSAGIGVFANAGQVCCACSRIYVQSGIYDKFVEQLKKFADTLVLNDQWVNSPFYLGPVVDKKQYDTIRGYINLGIQEGAKLIGEVPPQEPKGYFIKPQIFTQTHEKMRIVKEEIFGPVAVICKFDSIDEAILKANDSHFGLGAAVFSQNINRCMYISNQIQSGTVWVNTILLDVYSQQLPFGGYKESGFGREGSDYALQEWSQVKVIKIKYSAKL